jgi:raffinose/stachyose/melibiose transport system substrate-binding protein
MKEVDMATKHTRRDFLKLTGMGVGTLALLGGSACSSGSSGGGSKSLLVWYWGEQEAAGMKDFMETAVRQYKAKSQVDVTAVLQESDTLYTAFRTAAESGKGPDVQFFWGGTQALEDVWLGNVAALSDYIPQGWLDNVPVTSRRETYWNGKQWGLPFYQIGTAWAYNKKMFTDAGLDPESPPLTWDDFLTALQKLKGSGVIPIGSGFKDAYLGGWLISYMGDQNFNSIDEAIKPFQEGGSAYSGDTYVEWVVRLQDLIRRGFFNDDILSLDLYQGQDLFATQKAAITNSVQPQIVNFERQLGKDTVGVMNTPVFGTGTLANKVGAPCQVLTITSFTDKGEDAADFLEYLHEPDTMHEMYRMCGAVAPDNRFDSSWLTSNADKQFAQWVEEKPNFWYQYYYPFPFERDGVTPGIQQLFQEDGTPEKAIEYMQDAIDKWRSEHPDQVDAYNTWELLE